MSDRTWTAHCRWEDGWWIVEIPEAHNSATQARRLDQVPQYAVELLELMEGVEAAPEDIVLDTEFPGNAGRLAKRARRARQRAKVAQAEAEAATADAVPELAARGLPHRDIGALLGMTHQRVSQILASRKAS
jgi:hypothetical protein